MHRNAHRWGLVHRSVLRLIIGTGDPRRNRRRAIGVGVTSACVILAGCTSGQALVRLPDTKRPVVSSTAAPTTTTTEQPGWTPVSTVGGAIAIDSQSVAEPTGHVVTVFRFRAGRTRFALHLGSSDPPRGNASVSPDQGPVIGPDEAPVLLAAFNGGFETSAGAGGFELSGQVLRPLIPGYASLVIDADGTGHVGVWGQGLPAPGEQVASVRQNLTPLVADGQPAPSAGDIAPWGATLGGGAAVARSSVAEDSAGNLLYAASMNALPIDLADALISAGAATGMELDINPEWVQLASAPVPGGTLAPGIPGQRRPGDQYQVGWSRDFVTVVAATPTI